MKSLELRSTEVPAGIDWSPCTVGFCFLLIEQGRADFKSGSFWRLISEGDAVVLKKGSRATLRAMAPKGFTVSYFHFFSQNLYGLLTLGEIQILEMSHFMVKENAGFYPSTSAFAQSFSKLAKQRPLPSSLDQTCQMLQLVATVLNERKELTPQPQAKNDETADRVIGIIKQLRGSELEEISVEELARKCGCSRRHLGRVFREHFGNSISSHKMGLRLEKAARLLLNTHSRIIDVANACGFVHIGQFSAKFKEKYGATPSKWRQIALIDPQLGLETEDNFQDLGLIAL